MLHDRELLDKLADCSAFSFEGEVFRATRRGLDPLTPSVMGGRWMIPGTSPVLYTSCSRDGALAELAYHWSKQDPPPSKPAILHKIAVHTLNTVRLTKPLLIELGVDWATFVATAGTITQKIGSAIGHLEFDSFLAPSARWPSENLMLLLTNRDFGDQSLRVVDTETVDWIAWRELHASGSDH